MFLCILFVSLLILSTFPVSPARAASVSPADNAVCAPQDTTKISRIQGVSVNVLGRADEVDGESASGTWRVLRKRDPIIDLTWKSD